LNSILLKKLQDAIEEYNKTQQQHKNIQDTEQQVLVKLLQLEAKIQLLQELKNENESEGGDEND
jgi:hypothetical protein